MKIKLIDFGVPEHQRPYRPHGNDAGADVYLPYDCTLQPGEIAKIPLGFGLEIPDGYAGYIFPRTSMAVKGLVCELPPVDSGYRGEMCIRDSTDPVFHNGKPGMGTNGNWVSAFPFCPCLLYTSRCV